MTQRQMLRHNAIEAWGDDAEDWLEVLPPACAVKSGGDAGEGTRIFHLPRRGSGARVLAILFEYGNGSH